MNDRETKSRAELEAEVAGLKEENARLRPLLGLDERKTDGHATAWSPMLLPEQVSTAPLDSSSPDLEKLALLASLFGARSDVQATRWENVSTGKAGWSPAPRRGWSRQRSRQDYLPLTDEVFAAHLQGRVTVGIYPLLRGDICALLACDFDKGRWLLDALAYLDACHANGVPAALERSRSGNGGHVWGFGPVPATVARSLGAALLRQAMSARAELDLTSYDRLFPSQDFLPKAGFGNLIALPLHGESAERGNTLFLDPKTMEPWPDSWSFLSSVARMSPGAVSELAGSLRPVDAGPMVSLEELARRGGPPPPPVIRARLGAMLLIERAGLPPAVVAAFKHLGSIANPEFYEKQRMRFSTWDTPRFISCYGEDLEWLHLPRGLTERVTELVSGLGSEVELADDHANPAPIELTFAGTLRPQQGAAVADLVDHDRSVLVAPPGAGKTVMACAVIANHCVPTLVVVDRKELLDQWRTRLAENLGLGPKEIGQIGGGKDKPSGMAM